MKTYEVTFTIEGSLQKRNQSTGNIKHDGLYKKDGLFYLKNGRVCYYVEADSPIEAWDEALDRYFQDDSGDLIIVKSEEHISLDEDDFYEYKQSMTPPVRTFS